MQDPARCHSLLDEPSSWVRRFASQIPSEAAVLDVACGSGRHARFLARQGCLVEAVDRDPAALAQLAGVDNVNVLCADLEHGPWPYSGREFAGIVIANYLHRPLLPLLIDGLAEGG